MGSASIGVPIEACRWVFADHETDVVTFLDCHVGREGVETEAFTDDVVSEFSLGNHVDLGVCTLHVESGVGEFTL